VAEVGRLAFWFTRSLVDAVVSAETEKAVGLFVRREQAERFLEDVRADEPDVAEKLRLEPVELED
jgi:Tic22-like family